MKIDVLFWILVCVSYHCYNLLSTCCYKLDMNIRILCPFADIISDVWPPKTPCPWNWKMALASCPTASDSSLHLTESSATIQPQHNTTTSKHNQVSSDQVLLLLDVSDR